MKLGVIVEGHGDAAALPILIQRLVARHQIPGHIEILRPFRVPRSKLVKRQEIARAVEFVARQAGVEGPILIVADADDDCPAELGPTLAALAREARSDRHIGVVLAEREFETWFVASVTSLAGQRGLPADLERPNNPEALRGSKEWLSARMPTGYSETLDQPAFAALMDLDQAMRVRSFARLARMLEKLLSPATSDAEGPPT